MSAYRLPYLRGAAVAVALLLGGFLGWVIIGGHRTILLLILAVGAVAAALAAPLGLVTQAFVFVSQAFPKAGRFVHSIPIDVGVVLSLIVLGRWGYLALTKVPFPHVRPAREFRSLMIAWLAWLAFEFLTGVVQHGSFGLLVVEGSALGAAPLAGYWIASLPEALLGRVLAISRVALIFIVCFVFLQALLHGHHTAISGLTVEAGNGLTGYQALYSRNNATNVGLKMVATYQNGNLLGAYLALAAPLVLLVRHVRWRIVLFAAVLLAALLTLSRGAWISTAASFFILAALSRTDRWPAYAIAVLGPLILLSSRFSARLGHSFTTLSGRTQMYAVLWSGMTDHITPAKLLHWIIGWGLAGGPHLVNGGILPTIDSSLGWTYICTGLVGVGLYASMIILVVRKACGNRLGCILSAGMLGTLVFEAIDGQLFYVPTAWNFWLFAGLALASARFVGAQVATAVNAAGASSRGESGANN